MAGRLSSLNLLYSGYLKTGVSLVTYTNGEYSPFCVLDDIGIYVLIPKLANFLNISCVQATQLFFYGILFIPLLLGVSGLFFLEKNMIKRVTATMFLLFLTRSVFYSGDVYIAYFSTSVALIPWYLYFYEKKNYSYLFWGFVFFSGLMLGFFHYIRAYSGLGVLGFIGVLYFGTFDYSFSVKRKLVLFLLIVTGFYLSSLCFNSKYTESINFFHDKGIEVNTAMMKHPIWHPIYLGFGFLKIKNKDKIVFSDRCGDDRARIVGQGCTIAETEKYESVLKREVFHIFKDQTVFFFWTLFAKLGVLFWYILKFANIGVLFAFIFPNRWIINCAFLISVMLGALFPLMAIPSFEYSLVFISCSVLWGIVSINNGMDKFLGYFLKFMKRIVYRAI